MTALRKAALLVFVSLLSCCVPEEASCPAGLCTCKLFDIDGVPRLLSYCTNASLHDVPRGLDNRTTDLDLSDNNLTRLENRTFSKRGTLHLARVFVNRNHIASMDSGTFRELTSLSELHLESNVITSILPGMFGGNPELVILNLRKNRLASVPVDIITLKNHIRELDIGDNNIKKVDTYLVQRYYPKLRRLDVSRNRISRIFSTSPVDSSTLEVIDASFNYISELDPSALSSVSNLKELNVSNNKISNLSQDIFANNPELVKLDVSNNHIVTIHRDAFRRNPKITEIYAGSNGMTYLHPATFSGNPQLTKVTVSWNKIQDISPQTFYNNPNLEYLDFNNNKLKALNPGIFQNNPSLKSVDLSSNSLVTIHDTTFHHNPKLEHLFLSRNEHIRLHNGLIILASSLKVFDARHCNLSSLPANFFKNSTALRQLLLGGNNLTSLDCVSNNNDDDYVDTLTKLQVIDVSHNQLQTINVEVLKNKMTQLESLRIEGNPFLCDCKLREAWLWSQKMGIIPPQPQITCTDMQWRSVPWDDVQDLNCSDESLTEESTSAVTGTHTINTSAVPYHLNSSHESRTKESTTVRMTLTGESTSTVTGTDSNLNNKPQYVDWQKSSDISKIVLQVEKHDNSAHKERSNKILFTSLFVALGIILVMLLAVFLMRKRCGKYKVSKTTNGMKSNNSPSSLQVSGAPAL
ncbi:hypothetical protein B7P43_G06232 [Cryptotermes secundus]|uniref:LRRCT domain-containing protein n=1 Tax=Cryptotermes secundus TaxID=105785 RepID=A0A2J7RJT3_9NEOP|nr:leucine-rich repeat-containing protein 15 [Cryptotermes secundus]PNF41103.1 hypothetical protein B7P43_G06232 [Cryptotermes secundus]